MAASRHWKPLLSCLLAGAVLSCLPHWAVRTIRGTVMDFLRPGQEGALRVKQAFSDWSWFTRNEHARLAASTTDRQLARAKLEIRRLRIAYLRLEESGPNQAPPGGATNVRTASQHEGHALPLPPRLLTTHLVAARVLGRETIDDWRAGRMLDATGGVLRDNLVITDDLDTPVLAGTADPGTGHLAIVDRGLEDGLTTGQPVYAGRRVAGRIKRVARFTSTLQPLTDPRFRGRARLVRLSGTSPQKLVGLSRGLLEGNGDGTCRLGLVPSTATVAVGDIVLTDGRDAPDGWAMHYGTVISANLGDGAPHWEIRVKPAVDLPALVRVEILTRRLNPDRTQVPGVLAQ